MTRRHKSMTTRDCPRRRLFAGAASFALGLAAALGLVVGATGIAPGIASATTVHAAGLGPGEYWYERTEWQIGSGRINEMEVWTARDGSGRIQRGDDDFRFAGPSSVPVRNWNFFSTASYDEIVAFPVNDDAALLASLASITTDPTQPFLTFATAGDLLGHAPLSIAQRAAFVRVMANLPGAISLGSVRDERGRTGIGLAYDFYGVRNLYIVDARTSALLDSYNDVVDAKVAAAANPHLSLAALKIRQAYLATGVVGSIDSRPQAAASGHRHRAVRGHGKPRERAAHHRKAAR